MTSHSHRLVTRIVTVLTVLGGFAATLAPAAPPNIPAINQAPTGLQLTGKLIWFDLLTQNAAGAKKFYGPVFGWKFSDPTTGPKGDFSVISVGSERIGGIYQRNQPAKSGPANRWLTFISVPDAAAAARYAESHGGKIVSGPTSVPARGTHVILRDPEGALFGVLKSDSGDPIDDPAKPGEILWADLFVPKPANAAAFYGGLLGWSLAERSSRAGAEHLVASAGGFARAGITVLPTGAKQPGWLPYVQVENVGATLKRVTNAGGKVLVAPRPEILGGQLAVVADPQGGAIGVVHWTGSAKKGNH